MPQSNDSYLTKLVEEFDLYSYEKIKKFILENPLMLSIDDLSRIAEITNSHQESTAAYYSDPSTVEALSNLLPKFEKSSLRILEPSVGVGNILRQIINKYKDIKTYIEIDVIDINKNSLEICQILLNKEFDLLKNIKINYINDDFLTYKFSGFYDLVIGNPPFIKICGKYLQGLRRDFDNKVANNICAFFLDKSISLSSNVVLIMPKYFLHNFDFSESRNKIAKLKLDAIIDFGEHGFKGVLIETICLSINTLSKDILFTDVISIPQNLKLKQIQKQITDPFFPNWLIYIDEDFIKLASQMTFNIFNVYRDRQITSKLLKNIGEVWVVKSKNIPRTAKEVIHTNNDQYIDSKTLKTLGVDKYFQRDDVYLSPNMTYYPRVVKKPQNCVVNGSVAILELKIHEVISEEDLVFFASSEFEDFYRIARNYSTRSLNIDNISIFYFGRRKYNVS